MNLSVSKPSLILILIFLGFLFSGYKNDGLSLLNSEWWSDITYHPFVNFLKNNNLFFGVLFVAISLIGIIKNLNKKVYIGYISILFIYINTLFTIRIFFESFEQGMKLLQSLIIYIFFLLGLVFLRSNLNINNYSDKIIKSLYFFSIFYTSVSMINYIFGYGFSSGIDRYFGVTTHPNFSAVQQGLMTIILLYFFIRKINIIRFLILILGFYLLLITGSRTGVLLFAFGALTLLLLERRFSLFNKVLTGIFITLFSIIYFVYFSFSNRLLEGENTRSEAWESMVVMISEKPIIGYGEFVGYSENSYMRSMIVYGIPLSLFYFILLIYVGYKLFIFSRHNDRLIIFFAIYVSLMVSAIFEGFIIDLWSMPKFMLLILVYISSFFSINRRLG